MRKMKRFIALAIAAIMMLAMGMTAMAANVTVNDTDGLLTGHTFKAYQIFSGTQETENDELTGPLGDIVWGSGINNSAFFQNLKEEALFEDVDGNNAFEGCITALDVANVIKDCSAYADKIAQIAYANRKGTGTVLTVNKESELLPGYYLIVDETTYGEDDKNQLKNAALLQVTGQGDIDINVKVDKPDVKKTVGTDKEAVGDYNIGDSVPFELTSKVPNTEQYKTYVYKFHDTMSNGFTFNEDSMSMTIGTKDVIIGGVVQEDYKNIVTYNVPGTNNETFEIVVNIKTSDEGVSINNFTKDDDITITYDATLNRDAIIGNGVKDDPANWNKVYLEYSNNPNEEDETTPTEDKEVKVYTFGLDITKIDGDDNTIQLSGAEFVLYREVADTESSDPSAKVKEYVKVTGTDGNYKVSGWGRMKPGTGNLKVDEEGELSIDGLDAGEYYLEETKAPAGYNLLKDAIKVEIIPAYNNGELSALNIKVNAGSNISGNIETGAGAFDVENNQGTTLPETGGMGTTILYIAGILAMAAAVFYFVSRKKRA